jgi:hypothetical protein
VALVWFDIVYALFVTKGRAGWVHVNALFQLYTWSPSNSDVVSASLQGRLGIKLRAKLTVDWYGYNWETPSLRVRLVRFQIH